MKDEVRMQCPVVGGWRMQAENIRHRPSVTFDVALFVFTSSFILHPSSFPL